MKRLFALFRGEKQAATFGLMMVILSASSIICWFVHCLATQKLATAVGVPRAFDFLVPLIALSALVVLHRRLSAAPKPKPENRFNGFVGRLFRQAMIVVGGILLVAVIGHSWTETDQIATVAFVEACLFGLCFTYMGFPVGPFDHLDPEWRRHIVRTMAVIAGWTGLTIGLLCGLMPGFAASAGIMAGTFICFLVCLIPMLLFGLLFLPSKLIVMVRERREHRERPEEFTDQDEPGDD